MRLSSKCILYWIVIFYFCLFCIFIFIDKFFNLSLNLKFSNENEVIKKRFQDRSFLLKTLCSKLNITFAPNFKRFIYSRKYNLFACLNAKVIACIILLSQHINDSTLYAKQRYMCFGEEIEANLLQKRFDLALKYSQVLTTRSMYYVPLKIKIQQLTNTLLAKTIMLCLISRNALLLGLNFILMQDRCQSD